MGVPRRTYHHEGRTAPGLGQRYWYVVGDDSTLPLLGPFAEDEAKRVAQALNAVFGMGMAAAREDIRVALGIKGAVYGEHLELT